MHHHKTEEIAEFLQSIKDDTKRRGSLSARTLIEISDVNGLTHEFENSYSVSGPGDIFLHIHSDGFTTSSNFHQDQFHKSASEAIIRIHTLSDEAWIIETKDD